MLDPRKEPGEEQVALLVIKVGAGNLERDEIAKSAGVRQSGREGWRSLGNQRNGSENK